MKKEWISRFFSLWKGGETETAEEKKREKRARMIFIGGIAGILLIGLSGILDSGGKQAAPLPQESEGVSAEQDGSYALLMENRLKEILEKIENVGKVDIFVTLEESAERVYAKEEKRTSDKNAGSSAEEGKSPLSERATSEEKYILIEGEGGKRQALLLNQVEPKVRGVVVVCEGADQILVEQIVVETVTTALNIPSTRVCVAKRTS